MCNKNPVLGGELENNHIYLNKKNPTNLENNHIYINKKSYHMDRIFIINFKKFYKLIFH